MPERLLSAAACAEIAARAAKAIEGPWLIPGKVRSGTIENDGLLAVSACLHEDIPALLRTVAALRDALEPFADVSIEVERHPGNTVDESWVWSRQVVRLSALRRAAAVYAETK